MMTMLYVTALLYTQHWHDIVNAGQSEHRFHTHTKQELEKFEQMLEKKAISQKWIMNKLLQSKL